jgi:phosphonate transport system substrate-binding protein
MILRTLALTAVVLPACSGDGELPFVSLEPPLEASEPVAASPDRLRVGIAPVLSAVPSFEHYNPLVEALAARVGRATAYVQRGTYHEINELTRRGAVDLAFVCVGPWILNGEGLELLVVPEIGGSPSYNAVCLTQAGREVSGYADLKGASFGFTDTLSFTGRAYTLARLAELGTTPEELFERTVQVEGHDVLVHLIASGEVDAGCVSSQVFDQFRADEPELVASLSVFERSGPHGTPPVLVSEKIDPTLRDQLQDALIGLDDDPQGKALLELLHVDRFILPPPGLYDETRRFLSILDREQGS